MEFQIEQANNCHRNKNLAACNKHNYTVLWYKMLSLDIMLKMKKKYSYIC